MHPQAGYTLIELMVALLLGLLITAAAIQLFTGGLLSARLQEANGQIQDSGLFGLEYMARDVRLANYDNIGAPALTDVTPWGGVVLTLKTATNTNVNLNSGPTATTFFSDGLATHGAGDTVSSTANEWEGLSNVKQASSNLDSDQLTIQFAAPSAMNNCEGRAVLAGDRVVQRYFVRQDANGASTDYVLACDANTPNATATANPAIITGLGDAGQIIMPRVDHFHVLLCTATNLTNTGTRACYTVSQYRGLPTKPRIVSVQVAALVRAPTESRDAMLEADPEYQVLDQTVKMRSTTKKYVRQVYSTTIALRNALGELNP